MKNNQLTNTIMVIRPCAFAYNKETAVTNSYQNSDENFSSVNISEKAKNEFDQFVNLLRRNHIDVIQFEDNSEFYTPDSIFPNNWISTHSDGSIFLYPMFASNRRLERRLDIVNYLKNNFCVNNIFDNASVYETKNKFLEGTGSMVLDRENKIAYASLSERTNESLFNIWCKKMNFKAVSFASEDSKKQPIYHTNVLMSVCQKMVFICLDSIADKDQKKTLLSAFSKTKKEVIEISIEQKENFLGNVLELKNLKDESVLIMSTSAALSLTASQKKIVNKNSKIIYSPLDTIEYFGGGSARCMITEIFLKPNYTTKLKYPISS